MARKEKNIHYVYKTTCNVTGRYYVGMHSTINENDGYMGSGLRLKRSIRKYGAENHTKEILEYFDTRELLVEAEKKSITPEMISDKNCMNLMLGGQGGFISDEQQRYRASCAGKASNKVLWSGENRIKNQLRVSKQSKELWNDSNKRQQLLKNIDWTGKSHSDETKKLMSETSKGMGKGKTNSQYGTCWITKDGLNKKIKNEDIDNYLNDDWVKGRK